MWGEGHGGLHKPFICLTAEIRQPLRKWDGGFPNNGWKRRGRCTKMRGRETTPFHANCKIPLSCLHTLITLHPMYCMCYYTEVRRVIFTEEERQVRVFATSLLFLMTMKAMNIILFSYKMYCLLDYLHLSYRLYQGCRIVCSLWMCLLKTNLRSTK